MCNALGIITYNDSSVYVEGMQLIMLEQVVTIISTLNMDTYL